MATACPHPAQPSAKPPPGQPPLPWMADSSAFEAYKTATLRQFAELHALLLGFNPEGRASHFVRAHSDAQRLLLEAQSRASFVAETHPDRATQELARRNAVQLAALLQSFASHPGLARRLAQVPCAGLDGGARQYLGGIAGHAAALPADPAVLHAALRLLRRSRALALEFLRNCRGPDADPKVLLA
ncbi:MAG: hypothetical protein EOO40_03945, partial [Deltaproteobacteria bacterium]